MAPPYPLSPVPSYFSSCTFTSQRNGILYQGVDTTLELDLSQATADHYQVLDYNGNLVSEADIVPLPQPTLSASNDLALAAVSWYTGLDGAQVNPHFDPGPAGSNINFLATPEIGWHLSASSLQLPDSLAQQFIVGFPVGTPGWNGTLGFIKSAPAQTAAVIQTAIGHDRIGNTATLTATSTNSCIAVLVGGGQEVYATAAVVDSAGNTYTRHAGISNGNIGGAALFTTTAAHPGSITSLTVTGTAIVNFAVFEISGALNTDPMDGAAAQSMHSASALLSLVVPSGHVSIPAPADCGWYRVYFTGPDTDSTFGTSYAATNFVVIRDDPNFPPRPSTSVGMTTNNGAPLDYAMKGTLGIGTSRISCTDQRNPSFLAELEVNAVAAAANWSDNGYTDAVRPRPLLCAFPNEGPLDAVEIPRGDFPTARWTRIYPKSYALNGANIYVGATAGTTSGAKVTIYYPNSSTVVEVYDNLVTPSDANAAMLSSAYVYATHENYDTTSPGGVLTPTALGNATRDGLAAYVAALYPLGITHFEGPSNEPVLNRDTVHWMKLFQEAVHIGHPDAIAIGPCSVEINNIAVDPESLGQNSWLEFLTDGGGAYCDEISFHDYNSMTNGDLNLGRTRIEAFLALLDGFGLSSKPLWQTEAGSAFTSVFGVYHPHRARVDLLHVLLWEQYGLARERNPRWYDVSHGFWTFPMFLEMADMSLNPQCVLLRVLAEETFGQTHDEILDFGAIGDHVFLGSVYSAPDTSGTAVIASMSYLPDATVTLAVSGTSSPLVTIDAFGNQSTVPVAFGRATIPVFEVPTYVRLPIGVTVSVYSCNDWAPVNRRGQGNSDSSAAVVTLSGSANAIIGDGGYQTDYAHAGGISYSAAALPTEAKLLWARPRNLDRVVIWCGQSWQSACTLVDFDVETTTNGTDWSVVATVTKTPTSFLFGTDSTNAGCSRETYWDEQWIFDVPFAPQVVTGLRLTVRDCSYGGEPDALCTTAGGQGAGPALVLQEIATLSDQNARPQYVMDRS